MAVATTSRPGLVQGFSNQVLVLISAPLLSSRKWGIGKSEQIPPLAAREEIEALYKVFTELSRPVGIEINVEFATANGIRKALAGTTQPLILHFIGHGTKAGKGTALVLEDETGMADPLTP